jgi:hypothetical protein
MAHSVVTPWPEQLLLDRSSKPTNGVVLRSRC